MKVIKTLLGLLVTAVLIIFLPLPYYISYPGQANAIEEFTTVSGAEKDPGELRMVTISQRRATPLWLLGSFVTPFTKLSPASSHLYDGESETDYERRQELLMSTSQQQAIIEAFRLADRDVETDFEGIYVSAPVPGTPSEQVLASGDVIVAMNGKPFVTFKDFRERTAELKQGEDVELTIRRNEKIKTVRTKAVVVDEAENRTGIGVIEPLPIQQVETDPKVTFELSNVGGPSAGMMFTLELYDQLTEGDLAHGHVIVGTGTIEDGGLVGAIGGAGQKVVAADEAGGEVFFVPEGENYEDARASLERLDSDMEIVAVKNVEEAITYLERMK